MRVKLFATLLLARHALSGPARRDCGQTKCYSTVNECGMAYGTCWTECANGMTSMPTITAPLCLSGTSIDTSYPVQTSETAPVASSTESTTGSLITPPPSLVASATPTPTNSKTCSPLWLCEDFPAVCGDLTEMYGGCYDTCNSAPPFESPPCSLSSSTLSSSTLSPSSLASSTSQLESAAPTSTPSSHAGTAFTEKPASDSIAPAIDDSRALVMAEMPMPNSSDAPTSTPSLSSELRVADVQSTAETPSPEPESAPIEAPANMRGAAIAKMMADKVRKPKVSNVPCWTPGCKEYELGIPSPTQSVSPSPVESASESSVTITPAPSAESSTAAPAEPPVDSSTVTPTEVSTEASAGPPAGTLPVEER